jgi:O-antigen/teichoic acid export membrane protein
MIKVSNSIRLFTSQLSRHLILVFTGNIFAAGLGLLAILIISKVLTVNDFGLFSITLSVILIVPTLANLGMNTSMIKFASSYLFRGKNAEAVQILRVNLYLRLVTSFILAVTIFNTAVFFSIKVFQCPDLIPLLKLAAFGVLFVSILDYIKNVLYTYKMFKKYIVLQLLVDLAKLLTVIILIFSLKLNIFSAVAVFMFIPLLGILLGFWLIRPILLSKRKFIENLLGQLFSYSKWVFVNSICSVIFPYIAIFMLAKMLSIKAAGIYGLAHNLTYIFPILILSLMSVLLPEVSRFREIEQFEKYVKGALKISLCLTIFIIPFLFLSKKIILFLFGLRYLDSIAIFNWLLLSYIPFTISISIRSALYSMNKPHTTAVVELFRVTVMILGCYLLIPFFGILVPAILALIINVIALGFLIMYVFKYIHEGKAVFQNEETAELPYS